MRLLIVNQFYAPDISPTAQLAASLAEHRAAAGDQVTILTSRLRYTGRPFAESREPPPGVRLIHIPMLGLARERTRGRLIDYLIFGALATARAVFMRRQDVVVSMTTPPFIFLAGVAHRLTHRRSRHVLWSMDCYPEAAERFEWMKPGGLTSRFFRWLNRRAYPRVDQLVCLDSAMRDLLLSTYARPGREPVATIIPNWERATDYPDVAPPPWPGYDDPELAGRFVVLYLGNAGVGHRFDSLLEAAARVPDDVVFLFVGGGIRFADLRDARDRGLPIVLREYVPKPETPSLLAGAGAALIVLDDEALGVMSPSKLHACLAMRSPVLYVGPAGSNVDDAIAAHGCGRSVRQGDVEGLLRAIDELRDEQTREDLASRARAAFDAAYCDLRTLPQWDGVLASLS